MPSCTNREDLQYMIEELENLYHSHVMMEAPETKNYFLIVWNKFLDIVKRAFSTLMKKLFPSRYDNKEIKYKPKLFYTVQSEIEFHDIVKLFKILGFHKSYDQLNEVRKIISIKELRSINITQENIHDLLTMNRSYVLSDPENCYWNRDNESRDLWRECFTIIQKNILSIIKQLEKEIIDGNDDIEILMKSYIEKDYGAIHAIVRNIMNRLLTVNDIIRICGNPLINKYFNNDSFTKLPKEKWDKDHLEMIVSRTLAGTCNKDYLLYLNDVAEYINGPVNLNKRKRYIMNINQRSNENTKELDSKQTPIQESTEYNTDMTEVQAKKTLRALSQSLIDDFEKDDKNKISQYTANIYANVISNNLLHKWAKGYRKVKITLDSYQSFLTFEFLTPPMSQDFVSRFINGRETLDGFLHRTPEIRIKMSPRIFHNMKDPDDAYNFFKTAIQYYDSKVERVGKRLMSEVMKLGHNMKHLIGNSKLSGIVTYPLTLLFVFDDVQISDKNTFTVSDEDVQSINKFVRGIASHYASPEKEKKKIVEDIKDLVKELKESCDSENLPQLSYLAEAVNDLYSGRYNDDIDRASINFIESHIDRDYKPTGQLKVLYEKFGVKKLKKIPQNIVTYITIEAENMRDSNDKMMIASYCISKIEIVEWYIELLVVGSKRYLVPHTKPYLENLRTQLIACYSKIMNTKIENPSSRPIIDIQYPKGYEG